MVKAPKIRSQNGERSAETVKGLSKREYFAGLAMQSIQDSSLLQTYEKESEEKWYKSEIARLAVAQADALLEALEA